jgi:hypothetical protein
MGRSLTLVFLIATACGYYTPNNAAIAPGGEASHQSANNVQRAALLSVPRKISPKDFFVRAVAYHKSGSVMLTKGVLVLTARMQHLRLTGALVAAPFAEPLDVRVGVLAYAMNGVDLALNGTLNGGYTTMYGNPRCPRPANYTKVFSISRNPFEMSASEMAYDAEPWGGEAGVRRWHSNARALRM